MARSIEPRGRKAALTGVRGVIGAGKAAAASVLTIGAKHFESAIEPVRQGHKSP